MNVNLHHLQLFYYVAKAQGISAAVRIIPYGIQQPAISQQLIQLEQDLGLTLFQRRPFALTPAGESLYRYCARFFDNLEPELAAIKDESGVRVRFGCPSVVSANYLPVLIGLTIDEFPDIRPHITELDGHTNFAALINREIDIAISFGIVPRSKAITVKKLIGIPMALVLPKGHKFVEEGFWPKTDFANEKWIAIQEESGGTQELREGLSQYGISPNFVASTNSIEAAISYVEMGLGIALMATPPDGLTSERDVSVLPLPDIFGEVNLSIAWHNDCQLPAKTLNFIVKTARDLSKQFLRSATN